MEKIDWKRNGKYQTKDGRKVDYIGKSQREGKLIVVVEVDSDDPEYGPEIYWVREDGGYWQEGEDDINDVIEIKPRYIYVLVESGHFYGAFSTEESAIKIAKSRRGETYSFIHVDRITVDSPGEEIRVYDQI